MESCGAFCQSLFPPTEASESLRWQQSIRWGLWSSCLRASNRTGTVSFGVRKLYDRSSSLTFWPSPFFIFTRNFRFICAPARFSVIMDLVTNCDYPRSNRYLTKCGKIALSSKPSEKIYHRTISTDFVLCSF